MAYTEINARRMLAKKLYEAEMHTAWLAGTWAELTAEDRRMYERDIEALFNPNDQEVRDALAVLGWRHDGSA